MTPFHLKIVTPDGLIYDGQAEELLVRTINGDIGILARHMNYVAPLGMGQAVIVSGGQRRNVRRPGRRILMYLLHLLQMYVLELLPFHLVYYGRS